MWFDVKAAFAEIEPVPLATVATPATKQVHVAKVASVAMPPAPERESRVAIVADVATSSDPERYLAHVRENGAATYSAVAMTLGWGASRAWLSEARLLADGKILIGGDGRAHQIKARIDI